MESQGKFSARPILRAHLHTLQDARTGRTSLRDYLTLFGIPSAAFVVFVAVDVELRDSVSNLIAATALVATLLFGTVLQLYDRATTWADEAPAPGPQTSRYAMLLEELTANAAYAAIVATSVSIGLVSYEVDVGLSNVIALHLPRRLLGAAILATLLHGVLVLALVLRRTFRLTQERLIIARTGAGQKSSERLRRVD